VRCTPPEVFKRLSDESEQFGQSAIGGRCAAIGLLRGHHGLRGVVGNEIGSGNQAAREKVSAKAAGANSG
jgi:hypothetical protein